jgi:hypothetical protein
MATPAMARLNCGMKSQLHFPEKIPGLGEQHAVEGHHESNRRQERG